MSDKQTKVREVKEVKKENIELVGARNISSRNENSTTAKKNKLNINVNSYFPSSMKNSKAVNNLDFNQGNGNSNSNPSNSHSTLQDYNFYNVNAYQYNPNQNPNPNNYFFHYYPVYQIPQQDANGILLQVLITY